MYLESSYSDSYSIIEKRNVLEKVVAGEVKVKFLCPTHEVMYEDLRYNSTHS